MRFQWFVCCTVLALGLTQMAAPAVACEGSECSSAATAKPGKPLQLGKFMRPGRAKSASHVAKARAHVAKVTRAAKVTEKPSKPTALARTVPLPPVPAPSQSLTPEAASAFAAKPAADVRVVDSAEINEIDLAAGPALPETNAAGQIGQAPTQAAETTGSSNRASADPASRNVGEEIRTASLASAPAALPESPARAARNSLPWIERFWSAMQDTFVALAAGWRYLFG